MREKTNREMISSLLGEGESPHWMIFDEIGDRNSIERESLLNSTAAIDEHIAQEDRRFNGDRVAETVTSDLSGEEIIPIRDVARDPDKHDKTGRSRNENKNQTDANLLGRMKSGPDVTFLDEEEKVLPENEYPVNIVMRKKSPIDGHVIGLRFPGKRGVIWMMVKGEPIFGDDGEIERVALYSMDITDIKNNHDGRVDTGGIFEGSLGKITSELDVVKKSLDNYRNYHGKVQLLSRTGSFEYDPFSGVFKGSQICNNLMGFDPDEDITIDRILDSIEPQERYHLESVIRKTLKDEGSKLIEITFNIGDRKVPLLLKMISHNNTANGKRTIIGIVQNITKDRINRTRIDSVTSHIDDLNRIMFEREQRIIEIKEEVNDLCRELGREPKYQNS